jgi:hypothetical protein
MYMSGKFIVQYINTKNKSILNVYIYFQSEHNSKNTMYSFFIFYMLRPSLTTIS